MIPSLLLGKRRHDVFARLGKSDGAVEGSRGFGAKLGETCLAWGFNPSPLAARVIENVLGLYREPAVNRVFYACYAGTHSSILAACLHLGLLSPEDHHTASSLQVLPGFDKRTSGEIGIPFLAGTDNHGTEIYALGTGHLSRPLELALCDLIEVAFPCSRACVCNVRGFLDSRSRAGGFLSRRARLVRSGRQLVGSSLVRKIPSMQVAVDTCLDLSSRWKDNEAKGEGEVIWIDGKAGLSCTTCQRPQSDSGDRFRS